ncbi:MAG: response regulator [Cohnella sp.]|nr:response regulator [Cohnella sp.]
MHRLLIVDDESKVCERMKGLLPWHDYRIEVAGTAHNGKQAWECIEAVPIDLVLTDIKMPVMNGLELTERIRAKRPHIKVIIMSAYNDFAYAQAAIRFGVKGYLLKPVVKGDLAELMRSVADELRQDREAALSQDREAVEAGMVRLLHGELVDPTDRERLPLALRSNSGDSYFRIVVCAFHSGADDGPLYMTRQLLRHAADPHLRSAPTLLYGNRLVLFVHHQNPISKADLLHPLRTLLDELRSIVAGHEQRSGSGGITLGIGNLHSGRDAIAASYGEAIYALSARFFRGTDSILFRQDLPDAQAGRGGADNREEKLRDIAEKLVQADRRRRIQAYRLPSSDCPQLLGRKLKLSNFLLLFSLVVVLALLSLIGTLFYYKTKSFIQGKIDHIQAIKVNQMQFDIARSFDDAYQVMDHLRVNDRVFSYLRVLEGGGADSYGKMTAAADLETLLFNLKKDNPFLGNLIIQTELTQYSSDMLYSANLPMRDYAPGENPIVFVNKGEAYRFFSIAPSQVTDVRMKEALNRLNAGPFLWSALADQGGIRLGSLFLLLDGNFFRQHIPYSDNMALLDAAGTPLFVGNAVDATELVRIAGLPEGIYKPGQQGFKTKAVVVKRLAMYAFILVYEDNVSIHRKQFSLILKLLAIMFAACALLSFVVSRVVSGAMLQPLIHFLKQMKSYEEFGDRLALRAEKPALSLHSRLIVYFAITILLPVVLFIISFYVQSMRIVGDELRASYTTVFDNTAHRIEQFIDQKSVGLARLSFDLFIRRLIMNGASEQDGDIRQWIRQNEYLGLERDTISIYDNENRLLFSNFYPVQNNNEQTIASMQRSLSGLGYELITDRSGASYIRLGVPIYHFNSGTAPIGMIRLDVNSLFFANLYADFKENNSIAYIVDEAGTIVSHSNVERIGEQDDGSARGDDYRFAVKLPHVPWYFVSEFDAAAVRAQTMELIYDDISIVLGLLLLAFLFAYGMSRYLVHPFNKLGVAGFEETYADRNEEQRTRTYGIEEVNQLSRTYNRMLDRIESLVDESLIANHRQLRLEYEKRESQLLALQAQINPHFLYNTLESLIYILEKRDNDRAIDMVHLLSNLFRYMTGHDRTIVPLREELAYAEAYVQLMAQRHDEPVECHWVTDDNVLDCGIVKLVLQPVIENVFHHGIPHATGIVVIEVKVAREGERIRLAVTDNGAGIAQDRLQVIRQMLHDNDGNGIGIFNVNKRLKLHYGEAFGLVIDSELGLGTRVSITIPFAPIVEW